MSSLEIDIFDLKLMVKSGLEFFILKLSEPLQKYLVTCQANSAFLGRFFCTGQQQLWRGSVNFKIKFFRPLFTFIFKSKMSKMGVFLLHLFVFPIKRYWVSLCPTETPCLWGSTCQQSWRSLKTRLDFYRGDAHPKNLAKWQQPAAKWRSKFYP